MYTRVLFILVGLAGGGGVHHEPGDKPPQSTDELRSVSTCKFQTKLPGAAARAKEIGPVKVASSCADIGRYGR